MQLEWKFCLRDSQVAQRFLLCLEQEREAGRFLGSTFPAARSHACFTEEQRAQVEELLRASEDVEFQQCSYYRGDLFDSDFGLKTFKKAYVQWCPSAIHSLRFQQELPPDEPWGLSMEGDVLLKDELRTMVDTNIVGLVRVSHCAERAFDIYTIENASIPCDGAIEEEQPLTMDCSRLPEADVLSLDNGVILLSARLAAVLKKEWDGMVHNKFQPVRCVNVPESLAKRNRRKIPHQKDQQARRGILEDIRVVQEALTVTLPSDYVAWVTAADGVLPVGWLSPLGGVRSELATQTEQEHEEAEPRMPDDLVPLYAHGDGDYICVSKKTGVFLEWHHTSGETTTLNLQEGFQTLVDELAE